MFIEQSDDEVYDCLKGGSENSRGKRLAISMVEEAWLSEKEESTLPTQGMRSIISTVSISLEGFLPSILLLVVIIVVVVIVAVILVVVVVAIVGVVIIVAIIGVFVVVGISTIIKLSFVIISFLRRIMFYYLLHQPLGYDNGFLQSLRF
ncbi:hypothetical protein Tco_1092049 [Tanacetum coccineum]|uniref:Uncharacterized protein n=1 Tax=Tanacetum coccineum TaxID=301880 RepID=A0ABQ5I8V5_9ASTR